MRRFLATLTLTATALAGVTLTSFAEPASASTGSTYYVNCSSSTPGDGSSALPWNSLSAVQAHGDFAPGDQILFRRGSTCKGRVAPTGSGVAGAPIVMSAYGAGAMPALDGGGTPQGTGTVQLTNQHDWTIQNLRITNTGGARSTSVYRAGVIVRNTGAGHLAGITLRKLTVANVSSNVAWKIGNPDPREFGGIIVVTYGRSSGDGFDNLVIRDNTLDHIGRSGIMVSNHEYPKSTDRNVRIAGNSVRWSRGDGIVVRGSTGARIDHNVVANAADYWPCPLCGPISPWTSNAGIWPARSKRVQIDHNEVYGTKFLGGDGEGIDIDASASDVVAEYNYVHDNEGGGILFCGSLRATARFNILENNRKSAFAFIGNLPAHDTRIYNNTVYQSKKTDAGVVRYFNGKHGSGIKFYNNIVYSYGRAYYLWPTKVWSRANTYVGLHKSGEPHGAGYSWVDPRLKNPGTGKNGIKSLRGYKPTHSSTFRTGIAIPKTVTLDFFGKKINPKHPPRGAAG